MTKNQYGFWTFDDNEVSVNSKWPVLGPKYENIAKAFKTIHINDNQSNDMLVSGIDYPTNWHTLWSYQLDANVWQTMEQAENFYWGVKREKIYEEEHGLGYKPLGYCNITGRINRQINAKYRQDKLSGNIDSTTHAYYGTWAGTSYELYAPGYGSSGDSSVRTAVATKTQQYMSTFNYTDTWPWYQYGAYACQLDSATSNTAWIQQTDYYNNVLDNGRGTVLSTGDYLHPYTMPTYYDKPYSYEITDKYLRVYRNAPWGDAYYRARFTEAWLNLDMLHQITMMTSFKGSSIDCTFYLCPYSLDDFNL